VQSISKNKIKWIRSLQQKKNREDSGLFVVEGEKMVSEALKTFGKYIEFLCITKSSSIVPENSKFEVAIASDEELKSISSLKNPNKSLIVLKIPIIKTIDVQFRIALDGIQDPGNMGTILRLADWFDVKEIICSKDTVDIYNPKVVQASMGAIFRINVIYCDLVDYLSKTKEPIFGALLEGENIYKKIVKPNGILVLGNEGNGISKDVISLIKNPITIPRFGKAESLNVSVATGILLSEFFRESIS
jgi:TrmH family RNA methyltransferase